MPLYISSMILYPLILSPCNSVVEIEVLMSRSKLVFLMSSILWGWRSRGGGEVRD